jgi:hypothetical protein
LVCFITTASSISCEEYPDYLLLFALPQLLLVQIGFCRLNVARPKLRRSKVYGNSIFRRGDKVNLSKRTEQIESQKITDVIANDFFSSSVSKYFIQDKSFLKDK